MRQIGRGAVSAKAVARRKLQSEQLQRREETELKKLLTAENRDKGKAIIEAMMKPRHEDEIQDELAFNFQQLKLKINHEADRVANAVAVQRADVAARKARGEITAEEAKAENDRLDAQLQVIIIILSALPQLHFLVSGQAMACDGSERFIASESQCSRGIETHS